MCERDSCLESALCYQRHPHSAEELSSRGYWENSNNCSSNEMLTATNMELLSYVQATTNNSMANSIASHVDLDVVNCSTTSSSNLSVSSSSGNTSSTSSVPQSSSSIGVNLRVTGQCSQGGRKYMEDFFSVAYQQSENAKDLEYAFVGIYDGHGGAEAATFAKEHLMMEIINQKLFWSDSDQDVLRAIREGYIATHYAMWRDQENWPKTATGLPSTAGTTATVAFIRREKIYIGHVGDSGIVLGYQNENEKFWRAKPLTTDHKPESMEERTRITRSGGKVIVKSGVPRVVWNRPRMAGHKGPIRRSTPVDEIPFLAVARSLGDLWSYNSQRNEFVVSPDPDVKVIKINPNTFRCLIFGTDGLWNVVTSQEAVDCVYEKETINERLHAQRGESPAEGSQGQWTNPSKGLVEKALRTWSSKKMRADNTSVVTVILYPPGSTIDDNTPSCQTQSYGLEYTQVNGEILTHDDATTYAELANKYLPPEEYRNFKYDDDVAPELAVDSLQTQYTAYVSQEYASFQSAGHDYFNPMTAPQPVCEEVVAAEPAAEDDEDDDEEEEEDAEESDGDDDTDTDTELLATYAASDCNQEMLAKQTLQMHSKLLDQESLDYMNSFAESYTDSLLNASMEETIVDTSANSSKTLLHISDSSCSDSTSSSNSSSYHSSMLQYNQSQQQELLMQHQQYQAQCMSQEEGYSLTKLETRGEQQMRNVTTTTSSSNSSNVTAAAKEVQTFKIFQQNTATTTDSFTEATETTPVNENASFFLRSSATSIREPVWDPRFPALCRFINSYVPPKLELNSLLQQEREEEQQVAMERMELQRCAEQQLYQAQHSMSQEPEDVSCAHFLEEELITSESNDSPIESTDSDPDATIQIHEISSSIASPGAYEEVQDMEVEDTSEDEIKFEKQRQRLRRGKSNIEFAEKIEILRAKSECMLESKPSSSHSASSLILTPPQTLRSKLPRAKSNYSSTAKQPTKALINPSPSKRTHYPNVPNENQRMPAVSSSRVLRHCNSTPYGTLLHQRAENRQLRSMAPPLVVDYAKRTLRSRNSLSKDMKAKSTLNLRRSTSMTSQFLRTTASTLLAANATQRQAQQQQQQLNVEKPTTPRPATSHLPIAVRSSKSAAATSTSPAHAINLRSRQVLPLAPTTVNAVSVSSSTSAHHMQQRRERRNLRSLSSMSTTAASRHSSREPNCSITYSKATRLQSTAANLAAPPPSPKLISAATRARSLLAPNPAVSTDYSKRSTLRSGASNITTTEPPTLQTRSRVQKRLNR